MHIYDNFLQHSGIVRYRYHKIVVSDKRITDHGIDFPICGSATVSIGWCYFPSTGWSKAGQPCYFPSTVDVDGKEDPLSAIFSPGRIVLCVRVEGKYHLRRQWIISKGRIWSFPV